MTLDVDAPALAPPAPAPPGRLRAETLPAVAMAVAWLGLVAVSVRGGGRDRNALVLGLLTLLPALAVLRGAVTRRSTAVAAAVPLAALLACVAAPRGWAGAGEVALWTYAALLFVLTRAYASTARRRTAVALAVALLGAHQVNAGLIPWLGGGDPARPMIGTFYWHNQFAAWAAAAALAAAAAALLGRRYVALAGGAAFALCATGVVLSTSRATLGLLVLGWLALGAVTAVRRRARGAARWAALSLAVPLLATVLTGPLAFAHGGSALGATERRAANESVAGNTAYRLDYWRAAAGVIAEHPLTGTGAGGYKTAALDHLPAGMQGSPYVHNGLLQAFAEGGLPLGLALALAAASAALLCLRRSRDALRANEFAPLGLAAAALLLMAHAFVDFDTAFAALPALTAVALGGLGARAANPGTRPFPRVPALAVAALLVVGLGAASLDDAVRAAVARIQPGNAAAARQALAAERLPDARVATAVVLAALPDGPKAGLALPEDVVRHALAETAHLAGVDAGLALRRLAVLALLGDQTATAQAKAIVDPRRERRPFLVALYADVLTAAGDPDGTAVVVAEVTARATKDYPRPNDVWQLVAFLAHRATPRETGCAAAAAERAFGPPPAELGALPACPATLVSPRGGFSDPAARPMSRTTPAQTARRHRP